MVKKQPASISGIQAAAVSLFPRTHVLHPRKQLVQIVIAAVSLSPGKGVIHVFAVRLQFEGEQLRDGQRGVAVVFADTDAVVLRAAALDEIHGIHDADGGWVCRLRAWHGAVSRAKCGEVFGLGLRVAEQVVLAGG